MKEIWKNIPGYEGLYMVSNLGRVKSLPRYQDNHGKPQFREGAIKPQYDNGKGYLAVNLYKNGKGSFRYVHILVATAFIPNPKSLPQVNHKDENKANNCVNNLEWCSALYNLTYGTARARTSAKTRNHKKTSKPIGQYSLTGELLRVFPSLREAERAGYNSSSISKACRGIYNQTDGFKWKYL